MTLFISKFLFIFVFISVAHGATMNTEVLMSRSDVIWGFDFLSDGKAIFTERSGKVLTFDTKTEKIQEIEGVPKVYHEGQGGLMDIRVHPKTGILYLTYSQPFKNNQSATTLATAVLQGKKLIDWKVLFTAAPLVSSDYHFGSRIEFDNEGHVFVSSGERGERTLVQDLSTHLGKIIRLNEDGSIPKDNPYVNNPKAKPEIWARGMRNPQGLAQRPGTKEIWQAEMGPQGGDEVNIIQPGKDYGWPVITYGREYDGPKIGEGTKKKGVEDPVVYWVPSISPSAMAFYSGDKIPEWKGNIFLATLSAEHLHRIVLNDHKVVKQEELFKDKGWRFRNVRTGTDGYLWFSTDEGKLGRIVPAKK